MKRTLLFLTLLLGFTRVEGQLQLADVANAAESIVNEDILYDPSYFSIAYPNGDVPEDRGVCTDVVIRTYRILGVDLQLNVHEDMKQSFGAYPKRWGLSKPDSNIDHRRVPNLMTYFERQGASLPLKDFQPGDVVCWDLGKGILHIGVVSSRKGTSGNYLVVHNIGSGQVYEDVLFAFEQIGHYRYLAE
ncbi:MAG: DUF1287 domain-containing protein [Flavobacteriales bacterium]|nr:DUF1287 domain-containing protein [Flavobacteriales bacterium]